MPLFDAGLFWVFLPENVGTGSEKDAYLRGSCGGGGRSHRVDRDLGELEGVESFSGRLPLNPSPTLWTALCSHLEIFPIQVGVATGVEPPSTWKMAEITCCAVDNGWQVFIGIKHLLYLCSCWHSWIPGGCHCPCPWWRTSCLCGCSWGLANLQTDAWGEWYSCSLNHQGKICIQLSVCPVSNLPAGYGGQNCLEWPESGSSWDPAKTPLWERERETDWFNKHRRDAHKLMQRGRHIILLITGVRKWPTI